MFLLCFLFFCIQALLQKLNICGHHHQTCNKHRSEEDCNENPCVPVIERACGKKQQKAKEITEDDLKEELDNVQKMVDEAIKDIDAIIAAKDKEILAV